MADFRLDLDSSAAMPGLFDSLSEAAGSRPGMDLRGAWQDAEGREYLLMSAPSEQAATGLVRGFDVEIGAVAKISDGARFDDKRPLFPGAKVYCAQCRGYHTAPPCG